MVSERGRQSSRAGADSPRDGRPWFADHPEYVPEWDVARDEDGQPITLTPEQGYAVLRALRVLHAVEQAEGGSCNGIYEKSRLLGRMLYEGLPPTRTKPPYNMGAPWWGDLPGGDPFLTEAEKAEREAERQRVTREMNALFGSAQAATISPPESDTLVPDSTPDDES